MSKLSSRVLVGALAAVARQVLVFGGHRKLDAGLDRHPEAGRLHHRIDHQFADHADDDLLGLRGRPAVRLEQHHFAIDLRFDHSASGERASASQAAPCTSRLMR